MMEIQRNLESTNSFELLSKRLLEFLQNFTTHLIMKTNSIPVENTKKTKNESSSDSSEESDLEDYEDLENSFALTMSSTKESK